MFLILNIPLYPAEDGNYMSCGCSCPGGNSWWEMVMGLKLLQQLDRFPPVNQQMLASYQNTDSFVDCVTFYTEPNSFLSLI